MPHLLDFAVGVPVGYLDTSIVVPFYCNELNSPLAKAALPKVEYPVLSQLIETEFTSALSQKLRMGIMDLATLQSIYSTFQNHLATGHYLIAEFEASAFRLARDWLAQFNTSLRTLDALHLATAHINQCELITADKKLAASAQTLNVACQLIA